MEEILNRFVAWIRIKVKIHLEGGMLFWLILAVLYGLFNASILQYTTAGIC
jgi:hypothetical protein